MGLGGLFLVDASVRVEAHDCEGLERLVRYCARPPLAVEHLDWEGNDALVYHLAKPGHHRVLDRAGSGVKSAEVHRIASTGAASGAGPGRRGANEGGCGFGCPVDGGVRLRSAGELVAAGRAD